MPAQEPQELLVQLQGPDSRWIDVGIVGRTNERTWFESFPGYWSTADRPVLGQIFEQNGPDWRPTERVSLPPWFSHLLPEGRLREAVARAAHVKPMREFFLLAHVGEDLPGALRVTPVRGDLGRGAAEGYGGGTGWHEGDHEAPLKFSLAGVQLKFSVVFDERGLTIPVTGRAGTWIAKLPDNQAGFDGVAEAELAGLALAQASGIPTPEAQLIEVDKIGGLPLWARGDARQALLVQRFDRKEGPARVHVEELAQVLNLPPGEKAKYSGLNFETVVRATASLCGAEAVGDVIDRIVLNVVLGNGDAHAKNWAYRYSDGHTPELSPAYDIVPTVLYLPDDDLGLNLNGSKRFEGVDLRSFEHLAAEAGWEPAEGRARALAAIGRVTDAWPVIGDYLPTTAVDRLTRRRDALPLLRSP